MSESVYITLKINGERIRGDSTVMSMGREGTIEAISFAHSVSSAHAATGGQSGRRVYEPIVLRKRIDRSSPLLWKALCQNQTVEAVCRFYRPNPAGDGTHEQFFTMEVEGGRIVDHKIISTDNISDPLQPALEEIRIHFATLTMTYENGGVEHTDSWSVSR
jgi:type VI secretion system secreted protein Hcp